MELHLLNLLFVLLAAWLAGNLAERFRYPSVLGELLVGIVLGPPVLGLLQNTEALMVLADLGVLLMMLYIGMEIDPRGLAKASWAGLLAAVGGFVTPFVLAYLTVVAFGGSTLGGLFVGIAAGITSLATKSRILVDLRLLDTRVAHVLMAGALISDTMALIAFAAILGVVDVGTVEFNQLGLVTLKALLFFAGTVTVGYKAFPWLGRRMTEAGLTNRTFHFTLVLLIAVLFAQLAELAGLHAILGAFIAGLFIRDNVLGPTLARDLTSSVREASLGLLAPIFFVTAGFEVSFRVFTGSDLWLLLAIVGVSVVGKILGTLLFYLPTGHGWREGLTVGMGMNGRGAVEIIVAGIGLERGLISQEIFSILVFMAIFTTATVPILLKWGTDWLRARGELVRTGADRQGTVIVGAGPMGRLLAKHLSVARPVMLIDSNPDRCRVAEEAGLRTYCGNALQEQDLAEAGAAEADSLVALTTNPAVNALVARMASETFGVPNVYVVQVTHEELERDGALKHLRASVLFGGPLAREEWEHRVALEAYSMFEEEVEEETMGSAFRDGLGGGRAYLPILVKRGEGAEPFHAATRLLPRDRVVVLRPEVTRGRGPGSFQQIVETCPILDLEESLTADQFFELAAARLTPDREQRTLVLEALKGREALGSTVLAPGLAIPHVTAPVPGIAPLLVARSRRGISFPGVSDPVHAVFTLVRVPGGAGSDLQTLAAIAQVGARPDFRARWREAEGTDQLRELLMGSLAAPV
jgi:Kef-type K+ transport system membrane component KefB/Trk K+ transport system NAD-binding subunit/mannitol/fructose-specific phosphotransferase system IIA component (Ntr-type)